MSEIKINWKFVILSYLALFALGLIDNARGPFFYDISNELLLNDSQASLFFAVTSVVSFLSGLMVPKLLRSFKLVALIRFGLFMVSTSFTLIAMTKNLPSLLTCCALLGIGYGIINVTQNLLIIESSVGDWRRRLLSGLHGIYAVSSLCAPIMAAQFFRYQVGWRSAFFVFSVSGVVGFVYSFFVQSERSASTADLVDPEKVMLAVKADLTEGEEFAGKNKLKFAEHKKIKMEYFIVGVMMSLYIIAEVLISTRYSLYVRRVFDYTAEQSAECLALFFIFLFLGRILFLIFSVKHSNLQVIEGSLISSLLFFILGLTVHPLLLSVCGLTMSPIFGLSVDFIAHHFHRHAEAAVSFCITLSGIFLVFMHYFVGYLTQEVGIQKAMYMGVILLIMSWIILQRVKQMQRVA